MTRFIILLLGFLMINSSSFAQIKTLNVFAPSGLSMRKSPKTSGQKTKSIPYGKQVIILENEKLGEFIELEELERFKIKGYWKKVIYEQDTGYVFDGYLSDLPVCGKVQYSTEFISDILVPVSKKYNLKYYPHEPDSKITCGYEQQFENGITIKEKGCNETGGETEIYLRNSTLQEAYIFAFPIYFKENDETKMRFEPALQELYISPTDDGVGCYMTIERFGKNGIKISVSCGC